MISQEIENCFWKKFEEKNKDNENFKKNYEKKIIFKYLKNEDFDFCEKLKHLSINAIFEAQNFIRDKNGISSVSLRDIKCVCIFYGFFVEYYRKIKKLYENVEQKEEFDEFEIYYSRLIIMIFIKTPLN